MTTFKTASAIPHTQEKTINENCEQKANKREQLEHL